MQSANICHWKISWVQISGSDHRYIRKRSYHISVYGQYWFLGCDAVYCGRIRSWGWYCLCLYSEIVSPTSKSHSPLWSWRWWQFVLRNNGNSFRTMWRQIPRCNIVHTRNAVTKKLETGRSQTTHDTREYVEFYGHFSKHLTGKVSNHWLSFIFLLLNLKEASNLYKILYTICVSLCVRPSTESITINLATLCTLQHCPIARPAPFVKFL